MIFELKRKSHVPLYTQIATHVREMIETGALKVGGRLPANRELARSLGVNRNTVATAYSELAADGLISSHVGRGTFVTAAPATSAAQASNRQVQPAPMFWNALLVEQQRDNWMSELLVSPRGKETISLAYALPQPDLFPLDDFRRSVNRALRTDGVRLFQLGASSGYAPLREHLAAQMLQSGIVADPDEILVTNGCQQSLNLIHQILVGPADEVAIESPTYPGALSVFCANHSKYVSLPVGQHGIDLDVLESVLSQRRPKLIYVIPNFQNPTGATMTLAARRRLVELAAKHRVPIVEDDIFHELGYDGLSLPPLKALDHQGVVIYIGSFSKIGFPGLRVGWIAAPRPVIERLNRAKQVADLHTSLLAQAALNDFARQGLLASHIKRIRKAFAARRDVMLEALEKYFPGEATWSKPEGGMSIWVRLPESINTKQVLVEAADRGVTFSPGDYFYASAPESNTMRLSYSMTSEAATREGVKRLGSLIKTRLAGLKKQSKPYRAIGPGALV